MTVDPSHAHFRGRNIEVFTQATYGFGETFCLTGTGHKLPRKSPSDLGLESVALTFNSFCTLVLT